MSRASETVGFLERRDDDHGNFDELVGGPCSVHFEMLSDTNLWIGLDHATDAAKRVTVSVWIEKGKLKVHVENDSDTP